jgi:hypothetical protein
MSCVIQLENVAKPPENDQRSSGVPGADDDRIVVLVEADQLRAVVRVLQPERSVQHEVVDGLPRAADLDAILVSRLIGVDRRIQVQLLAVSDPTRGLLRRSSGSGRTCRTRDQSCWTPTKNMLVTVVPG